MKQVPTGLTLKVIGLMMAYPEREMTAACADMLSLLKKEGWVSPRAIEEVAVLAKDLQSRDIFDLQEDYVALFDRTPSLSLHLFEHVHGDSRERGQAMVELDGLYREIGLENASEHTPDYLPMFLEYLSLLPVEEARSNLDGAVDVLAAIGERLKKRKSPYAALFDALQEAATRKPDVKKLQGALKADAGDAMTQEQMDKVWEEQFAFDRENDARNEAGCPKADEMLSRMGLPQGGGIELPQGGKTKLPRGGKETRQ